jgi:hypothetical protein
LSLSFNAALPIVVSFALCATHSWLQMPFQIGKVSEADGFELGKPHALAVDVGLSDG